MHADKQRSACIGGFVSRRSAAQAVGGRHGALAQFIEFLKSALRSFLVSCLAVVAAEQVIGFCVPWIQFDGLLQRLFYLKAHLLTQKSPGINKVSVGKRGIVPRRAINP